MQDNQTLTLRGPNKLILKNPNSWKFLPPHTVMPSHHSFQQRSARHPTPSHNFQTIFSAVLAQCQTAKRTPASNPKNPLLLPCSLTAELPPLPICVLSNEHWLSSGVQWKLTWYSQHEPVSPILLFLRLQEWRNRGIFIQLCLYTDVAQGAGG